MVGGGGVAWPDWRFALVSIEAGALWAPVPRHLAHSSESIPLSFLFRFMLRDTELGLLLNLQLLHLLSELHFGLALDLGRHRT
jgi:hypothetical protein